MAERTKSIWTEWSFVAGVVVTFAVLGLFSWSLTFPVVADGHEFASKWQYLQQATPNEMGDTLAGVAGSLAFVWVVVAVLFQATELREQREEFEKMADAQSAQAEVLEKQAAVFEDEQRQRDEQRAEGLLDRQLEWIVQKLEEETARGGTWSHLGGHETYSSPHEMQLFPSPWNPLEDFSSDFYIRSASNSISRFVTEISEWERADLAISKPTSKTYYEFLLSELREVDEIRERLSDEQTKRLRNIGLEKLTLHLQQVVNTDRWFQDVVAEKLEAAQ
ncbi:hypothetical protein ACFMBG_16655 [Leisingera sp. D0M16]|uniref:hypothetical protein n=1 Tax=Leisingera coralii TaxID=3351347 RepID=UPI003B7FAAA8